MTSGMMDASRIRLGVAVVVAFLRLKSPQHLQCSGGELWVDDHRLQRDDGYSLDFEQTNSKSLTHRWELSASSKA
jgi:hypothetical protein